MRISYAGLSGLPGDILHVVRQRLHWRELVVFAAIAAGAILVAVACSLLLVGASASDATIAENSPHELLQVATVALAAIGFLIAALRFDFETFYVMLLGSFGCAMASMRETPACSSSFYEGGPCLTGTYKDVIPFALALGAVALLLYRRVPLARSIREVTLFWLVPVGASTLMLVGAEWAEARNAVWIEETLELASFANLLAFALIVHLRPRWYRATLTAAKTVPPHLARRTAPADARDERWLGGHSSER